MTMRGGDQDRHGELRAAEARRRHHHQLAVGVELVEREQRAGEKGDRQDDDQQARQDQKRQIEEGRRRLAAIDHQIEQPQRLRQPDDGGQQKGEERGRADQLAQHIDRQSRQSHAYGRSGAG